MDRYPDLVDLLIAGKRHRAESFGDERDDLELPARAGHANAVAVLDALIVGELLRHLDEGLRLQAHEEWHVLRDVMLVLGESVARRDVRVVSDLAEAVRPACRLV